MLTMVFQFHAISCVDLNSEVNYEVLCVFIIKWLLCDNTDQANFCAFITFIISGDCNVTVILS